VAAPWSGTSIAAIETAGRTNVAGAGAAARPVIWTATAVGTSFQFTAMISVASSAGLRLACAFTPVGAAVTPTSVGPT